MALASWFMGLTVRSGIARSQLAMGSLVIILVALLMGLFAAYSELQARYEELQALYSELEEDYSELEQDYLELLQSRNTTVIVINDRDYFSIAYDLVQAANESIYVIMYVLKYDPGDPVDPVNDLVWALGNASQRGVEVAVIIENETWETSQAAYDYFVKVGVNVTYDPGGVRTHCKLVVVDRYIVLIGSHNWTESALSYNHETSVLIISKEVAEEEIRYFNEIWAEAQSP